MSKSLHRLSDTHLKHAPKKRQRLNDGGGLFLNVSPTGTKSWVFIYRDGSRNREIGLGSYKRGANALTLANARRRAQELRDLIGEGKDPLAERRSAETAAITFGDAADAYIKAKLPEWSNDKHIWQWNQTLGDAYCKSLRSRPVADVTVDDVLNVLQPIWTTKTETATHLRGRIEKVLNHAKARKWRDGPNPAVWRGHLDSTLPKPKKLAARGHHSAMPYADVPAFVARLRNLDALAGRALELAILTAARSAEILNAEWSEIDFGAAVWTVPAERMKMRKTHRVPLVPRAVEILEVDKRRGSFRSLDPARAAAWKATFGNGDGDAYEANAGRPFHCAWLPIGFSRLAWRRDSDRA